VLRENITATNYPAQDLLAGLSETMSQANLPDPQLAALKQLTNLAWRQAEVMTFNNLFQGIALIFFASLAVAPFLRKVDKDKVAAIQME
jgi:DHA2 family multidrug resistance protein